MTRGASQSPQAARPPQAPVEAPGSEPYPERELRFVADRGRGALDLVFLVDATGSMGPYIQQVQQRLMALVDALKRSPLCHNLRLGVVAYRDHPPQDITFITRVLELTDDIEAVKGEIEALQASGGGDGPEAVTDGLYEVVRRDWKPDAARVVVWFGDAPPHGVEPSGDEFPEGNPLGRHWYTQAESCREMGISVYAIGCLPGLRHFKGAEPVFREVARTTRGMFVALREAHLLIPLIAGAAATELDRQRIDEYVEELARQWRGPLSDTDEAERVRWLTEALRQQGVRPRVMAQDAPDKELPPQCFREINADDVSGALDRLRLTQRIPF